MWAPARLLEEGVPPRLRDSDGMPGFLHSFGAGLGERISGLRWWPGRVSLHLLYEERGWAPM